MASTYKIIWTHEALNNLAKIIEYLEYRWSKQEIQDFAKLLDRQVNLIRLNPELFPESKNMNGLRKSVLTKQTTVYYRIDDNQIQIVTLFDNRQNPKKMEK